MRKISKIFSELRNCKSGNAMLLMAMGMPVLVGGSGLAVDVAQWYMWKRELQYAVDQAAIAGAWARAEPDMAADYETRAKQEFGVNLSALVGETTTPQVTLADFGTGTDNSVTVSSSTSRPLPFSFMLTGEAATISVSAQATFEAATNFTTCMLALDPTASGAFVLGGSTSGTVSCGFGALSTSDTAMVKNGSSSAQAGYLVSSGGVDSGYAANGTINEFISNLTDPFSDLSPPASTVARDYVCPTASSGTPTSSSTTADVTTTTTVTYTYWQGKNRNQADTQVTYAGAKANSSSSQTAIGASVPDGSQNGDQGSPTTTEEWTGESWAASGGKNLTIYEKKTTAVQVTYANVHTGNSGNHSSTDDIATLLPGTYTNISIACDTHFSPGVYTITGDLNFGQNKTVTGTDVMFVLTGSASDKVHINSNSNIILSGITADTLVANYGLSAEAAAKLAGMLVFDPNSTSEMRINGNAQVKLDGIMYMPNRPVVLNGNSTVSGKCLMIASATITFTGNNDIGSFCIPAGSNGFDIGGTTVSVRLVA